MKKIITVLIIIVSIASVSFADIPNTLNYQGRLINSANQPAVDGQYAVTFRFYAAESGGTMVWEEAQSVNVKNGYFNTTLGAVTSMSPSIFNQPLWVGIQVGNNAEMTPRQKLGTSAYAMTVVDGGITTGKIANGSITADKIAPGADIPIGTILAWHKSYLAVTPDLPNQFVECNGQIVDDLESPYHGGIVPDLNGEKRFLRGSNISGTPQADQLRQHGHTTSAKRRKSSSKDADSGNDKYSIDSDNATVGNVTGADAGDETRPINMSVVWIIKIK
ncbi:hypothetical protein K8S19_08740 [bacterium]|nr:hypothetical protein [bacterium]